MVKLKLKRKMSGNKIRDDKRQKVLRPTREVKLADSQGNIQTYITPVYVRYPNKGLYNRNRAEKRHVENPNVYKGEKPVPNPGVLNIRIPKKGRKNAWKRFEKAFPYVKVNKRGQIQYTGNGII